MPPGSVVTAAVEVHVGQDTDMSDKHPAPPPHEIMLSPGRAAWL